MGPSVFFRCRKNERARHDASATGERLVFHSTLISADCNFTSSAFFQKVYVGAFGRKHPMSPDSSTFAQHVNLFDVHSWNNNMRNSGVNKVDGFVFVATRNSDIQLQISRIAHVQSHKLAMKLCGNDPGGRLERNFFTCISDLLDETGKTTRAIAAHFCFAAVTIIVTHPKISAVGRALDQQNPIRPDPAMTIANFRDLLRAQLHVAGAIVDHNKIVPRPVHLGESQHVIRVPQGCLNANRSLTVVPRCYLKALASGSLSFARDHWTVNALCVFGASPTQSA